MERTKRPGRIADGAVAEWLMAAVLKTAGVQALVSSNLTRSARHQSTRTMGLDAATAAALQQAEAEP